MKFVLTSVAALILLTACGQKGKAVDDPTPPGVQFLQANLPTIKVQNGDPATAPAALDALSLTGKGKARIDFASKEVNGDTAIFKNVVLKPFIAPTADEKTDADIFEDWPEAKKTTDVDLDPKESGFFLVEGTELRAERLELQGLAMDKGEPRFSRLVMSGVTFESKEDETTTPSSQWDDLAMDPASTGETSPEPKTVTITTKGKIGAIELVNPSREVALWVAGLFGQGTPKPMPEGAAFAFDRWAVDNIRVTTAGGDEDSVFLVKRVEILDLEKERAARTYLEGLSIETEGKTPADAVSVSLKRFDLRASRTTRFGLGMNPEAEGAIMDVVDLSQNDPVDPGFELMNLQGFKLKADGVKVDVDQLTSKVGRDPQGRAVKFVTEPYKIIVETGESTGESGLANQIAPLGFDKLVISGAGDQVYDPTTDLTTVIKGRNFFEVENGFRLDFSAKYEGAKAAHEAGQNAAFNPTGMGAGLDTMTLHRAEISLKDHGLVDRALNYMATQEGQDPVQFRKDIKSKLNMMALGFGLTGEKSGVMGELVPAVSSFIQKPKTLTIKMEPKTPVSGAQFENFMEPETFDKKALGFSATNR